SRRGVAVETRPQLRDPELPHHVGIILVREFLLSRPFLRAELPRRDGGCGGFGCRGCRKGTEGRTGEKAERKNNSMVSKHGKRKPPRHGTNRHHTRPAAPV